MTLRESAHILGIVVELLIPLADKNFKGGWCRSDFHVLSRTKPHFALLGFLLARCTVCP